MRCPSYTVHEGRRYCLIFRNASDDIHPLHLHRHSFELTRIAGKPTARVVKDVVMLGGWHLISSPIIRASHYSTVTSSCTWISGSWRSSTMRERSGASK
jgi:FtsP/CotA-like multicopper oxidase with cupredoxin domain